MTLPGPAALRIAVVGAESTGKSTLAVALAQALGDEFGLRATSVPERLRAWCDAHGRTPTAAEQWDVAREQQAAIDVAARASEVVVCDTTPLMTAVYSRMVFGDGALDELARAAHATISFTLLTALDLPWIADGLQRDGAHVREPVDRLVRERLIGWGVPWAPVCGTGAARTAAALDALRPTLAAWSRAGGAPRGLFSSLLASSVGPRRLARVCELCDDPDCEHAMKNGVRSFAKKT
jgi:nicotinamide riboside kinase